MPIPLPFQGWGQRYCRTASQFSVLYKYIYIYKALFQNNIFEVLQVPKIYKHSFSSTETDF
jgi:hypothetical protein